MNVATVVLTARRPEPTLDRTLDSLEAAGFPTVNAFEDTAAAGHFRAWMGALRWIVSQRPRADAYFVVEDDTIFCRGLHEYLRRTLWPGPAEKIALCSPYCPKAYRQAGRGWSDRQSRRGHYLAGSQAWIFPAQAARAVLAEVGPMRTVNNADWEIGRWAKATERKIWYHTPSLVQHVGLRNSVLGDNTVNGIRCAADFIGEQADPRNLKSTHHDALPNGAYSSDLALRLNRRGQWWFDRSLAEALSRLFQGKSVGDFGCGIGRYTDFFNACEVTCRGYDAIPDIHLLTGGMVEYLDLSVPSPRRLRGKFHWVLCLEVMEHVPGQFEAIALANLDACNTCGVVVSWAEPGQGGHGHVNDQVNQHAIDWFSAHGYSHDQGTQEILRQAAGIGWFKNTIMVFRKHA